MKRLMVATLCFIVIGTASAFQPRTGNWWNPLESGRDFAIDIQNGVLVLVVYVYQVGGAPQWYLSSGPMSNLGRSYTGTLDKYVNGQCISCPYTGAPTQVGSDGLITINFSSEIAATVTLPGGRTTLIKPFNFSGDPPQGLLGQWLLVHDNISPVAVKYNLTTLIGPTSGGNGIAGGSVVGAPSQVAGCELQTSGQLAGWVVCGDGDEAGMKNAYCFAFGVDETYGGYHIPASAQTQHAMKGYKTRPRSEVTTSGLATGALAATNVAPLASNQGGQETLSDDIGSFGPAIRDRSQAIVDALRGASNLR